MRALKKIFKTQSREIQDVENSDEINSRLSALIRAPVTFNFRNLTTTLEKTEKWQRAFVFRGRYIST